MSWDERIKYVPVDMWGELAMQIWEESARQESWRFRVGIVTFSEIQEAQRYATSADPIMVEGDASK
jgi:hypothetical protein